MHTQVSVSLYEDLEQNSFIHSFIHYECIACPGRARPP